VYVAHNVCCRRRLPIPFGDAHNLRSALRAHAKLTASPFNLPAPSSQPTAGPFCVFCFVVFVCFCLFSNPRADGASRIIGTLSTSDLPTSGAQASYPDAPTRPAMPPYGRHEDDPKVTPSIVPASQHTSVPTPSGNLHTISAGQGKCTRCLSRIARPQGYRRGLCGRVTFEAAPKGPYPRNADSRPNQ
jgi:hypothetical protein